MNRVTVLTFVVIVSVRSTKNPPSGWNSVPLRISMDHESRTSGPGTHQFTGPMEYNGS